MASLMLKPVASTALKRRWAVAASCLADRLDHGLLRDAPGWVWGVVSCLRGWAVAPWHGSRSTLRVFNGVGDGVGVQLLLEQVFRGRYGPAVLSSICCGLAFLEDGVPGKAEQLRLGKNSLMAVVVRQTASGGIRQR